jgi:adenylate kinase
VNIVMLGAPGAGKGTHGERLAEWLGVPTVSSGELFRAAIDAQTPLGLAAKGYIDRGDLVPDDVTIGMMRERLCQPDCENGVVLDGFPRNEAQARSLDEILAAMGRRLDLAIFLRVPTDELVSRVAGRLTCGACGAIYHEVNNPPRMSGVCDACGGRLQRRTDDDPAVLGDRIEVYLRNTEPLIAHYEDRGLLVTVYVGGHRPVGEVQQCVRDKVSAHTARAGAAHEA